MNNIDTTALQIVARVTASLMSHGLTPSNWSSEVHLGPSGESRELFVFTVTSSEWSAVFDIPVSHLFHIGAAKCGLAIHLDKTGPDCAKLADGTPITDDEKLIRIHRIVSNAL